jgi:hypothetical protein
VTVELALGDQRSFVSLCDAVQRTGTGDSCIAVELCSSPISDADHVAFERLIAECADRFGNLVKGYISEAESLRDLALGPKVDFLHLALFDRDDLVMPDLGVWFEMMTPGALIVVTTTAADVSSNFGKAKNAVADRYPSASIPLGSTVEAVVAQVPVGGMTPAVEFLHNVPTTVGSFLAILGEPIDIREDLGEDAPSASELGAIVSRLVERQQNEREAFASALRAYKDLTTRLSIDLADARGELSTQLEAARVEREHLVREFFDRMDELSAKIATSAAKYTAKLAEKDVQIENQERRVEAYAARAADAQSVLDDIRGSTSWRLTAPLRLASRVLVAQRRRRDAAQRP